MSDALPQATIGHRAVALTAWLHYGLGVALDQIVDIMGCHLQTRLTPGGINDRSMPLPCAIEIADC